MEKNKEFELTLNDIVRIFINKLYIIIIFVVLFFLPFSIYAFRVKKTTYLSTGSIMIQVESSEGNTNTTESQRLVQSTVDILMKMNLIPEETSKVLRSKGYDISEKDIRSNMAVSSSNNSLVITISFVSEQKDEARLVVDEIINTLIRVANDEKYNMDKTLKDNISKLYVSDVLTQSPNKIFFMSLGVILGGIVGTIVVFTNEMINSGYKEKDEIEEELNIQVLGVIPNFELKRGNE